MILYRVSLEMVSRENLWRDSVEILCREASLSLRFRIVLLNSLEFRSEIATNSSVCCRKYEMCVSESSLNFPQNLHFSDLHDCRSWLLLPRVSEWILHDIQLRRSLIPLEMTSLIRSPNVTSDFSSNHCFRGSRVPIGAGPPQPFWAHSRVSVILFE